MALLQRLVLLVAAALCSLAGTAVAIQGDGPCHDSWQLGRWGEEKGGRYLEFGPIVMCPKGKLEFTWYASSHGVFQIPSRVCPTNYTSMATDDYKELAGVDYATSYTWVVPEEPGTYYATCQLPDHCNNGMLAAVIVRSGARAAAAYALPLVLGAAALLLSLL